MTYFEIQLHYCIYFLFSHKVCRFFGSIHVKCNKLVLQSQNTGENTQKAFLDIMQNIKWGVKLLSNGFWKKSWQVFNRPDGTNFDMVLTYWPKRTNLCWLIDIYHGFYYYYCFYYYYIYQARKNEGGNSVLSKTFFIKRLACSQ